MHNLMKGSMKTQKYLNNGIYGVAEAARLTGASYQAISRWLFISKTSVLDPDYQLVEDQKALSFYDLIEVLIVSEFRKLGVVPNEIRNAHATLKENFRTEHPFCHKNLFVDNNKKIFSQLMANDGEPVFQEAVTGQSSIPEVIHTYLKAIDFDNMTNLAKQWNVAQGVTINPTVCFGKPVISNTRIPSHVIYDAFHANARNKRLIESIYELSNEEIENAISFETKLMERNAA